MRERLGKSGSLIDFQQQIGDPRGRELLIEVEHEILGPFGRVGPQLVDVQLAVLDDAAWDRAGSRRAAKLLQPCIQSSPALGQPFAGSQRHGEPRGRSEEHTSELQSLMRISYAVFCLKKKIIQILLLTNHTQTLE